MKAFKITYYGSSKTFQNMNIKEQANTPREAVEKFYAKIFDLNYFPQDDGSIKNCSGQIIAKPEDDYIKHDGGYFEAEEVLEDAR